MTLNHEGTKNKFQLIKQNWSNYLINTIAITALVYVFLLLAPMWSGARVYWLYVNSNPRTFGEIICLLPPVIALFLLAFWFIFGIWRYKSPHWLRLILLPLMTGCCLTYFSIGFFMPALSPSQHLDEVRQGINLYRATLWNTDNSGGSYNILFQCDPLGILCAEVCSMSINNSRTVAQELHLYIDEETQTVAMMDGNTILCPTGNSP
ncbi:MAG: hypothetical protein LCI00_31410 [Chloroflexi bacterium]|nr:hypothetical protein [Chloroflexota bacterium]MCC6893259.1 hypothetical protein [Anaerolineae bacterium]